MEKRITLQTKAAGCFFGGKVENTERKLYYISTGKSARFYISEKLSIYDLIMQLVQRGRHFS